MLSQRHSHVVVLEPSAHRAHDHGHGRAVQGGANHQEADDAAPRDRLEHRQLAAAAAAGSAHVAAENAGNNEGALMIASQSPNFAVGRGNSVQTVRYTHSYAWPGLFGRTVWFHY